MVQAVSPQIPRLNNGRPVEPTNLAEVMPPYGSMAVTARRPQPGPVDLASRVLYNDPRDLWYLSLPTKLTPSQVLMILRSALGGDLWQQWQLQKLMSDSWVMFRKCAHELRSTVSSVRYTVHPYHEPNKQPSAKAKAKADCVARGLTAWRPDPFSDEKEFDGLVYHLLDSVLSGITLCEIQWQVMAGEILPRAATWVHPRQYTFSNGGKVSIWDMNFKAMVVPDPDKFMVMQYLSDSGSALGCGLMRPLGWYWSGLVFNREWMLKFGQKYGSGFFKLFYPDGATETELQKLEGFAAESLNKGWILLRKDLEDAEYHPPTALTQDNPHKAQIDEANEAAQMLLLGQTATTNGNKGSSGINTNNNQVQLGVLTSRKEELASAVAKGPVTQLARAICRVNFDDDSECPVILPDMTTPMTAAEKGQIVGALNGSNAPMVLSDYYELTGTQVPTHGQQVIIPATGKIGVAGSMDVEMDLGQPPAPVQGELPLGPDGKPIKPEAEAGEAEAVEEAGSEDGEDEDEPKVKASQRQVKRLLARASDDDVLKLSRLVIKAVDADHANGELSAVETEINRLKTCR